MELGGGRKGKENDRESTILTYITSVQIGDIIICNESCPIMGWGEIPRWQLEGGSRKHAS
jgi:hypothetical protein